MNHLEELATGLHRLSRTDPSSSQRERATVLFQDFQWCRDAAGTQPPTDWSESPSDLAAADAAWAHLGDRDDVHWATTTHPGSIIWPVVLHIGRAARAEGVELVRAAVTGYAATCTVANALGSEHRLTYHSTATAGTIGAAAAAASLLQLPAERWVDALGHAFSVLGGSRGAIIERSSTRAFHRAHAVRTGVAAARFAASGGAATRLDLERGLGPLADLDRLGIQPDALDQTSVRIFPTSGWNQAVYEAALVAGAATRGAVRSIEVQVPSAVLVASTDPGWDEATTGEVARLDQRARFDSVCWAVSGALAAAIPAAEGSAAELVDRVVVVERAAGARVRVIADESCGVGDIDQPLDHPDRRASLDDLAAIKWHRSVEVVRRQLGEIAAMFTSRVPTEVQP